MHVDAKGFLKCGAGTVSPFCQNSRSFFAETGWGFYSLPTGRVNRAYFRKNHRYTTKSLQMVGKVGKEMDLMEDIPEYPALSSYDSAMEALSSLISRRNRGDPSSTSQRYDKLERVSMYLKILGLEEKIKELKIIHVAGTKGKGSTCVFSEAILRNCGFRTGLFTSPHLIDVRERFRIDGLDISEEKFLQYFWECWNLLKEKAVDGFSMPPLFQFLTVLAFKIFVCEKVDVAIIEVGLGGKLDSTNVIQEPIVCGITSLGMDHMETLGNTLAEIASHKAGIFKPEIPAFTVPQLSEAMEVLQETADNLKAPLTMAAPLDLEKLEGVSLGLSGDHQLVNAGLAISLSKCWLQRTGNWAKIFPHGTEEDEMPEAFRQGLATAQLRGRAQVVHDIVSDPEESSNTMESPCGDLIFYLDGAHSPESMEACGRWFSATVKGNKRKRISPPPLSCLQGVNGYIKRENRVSKQILLFNCMEVRDPQVLLPRLINTCGSSGTHFSRALFVPSMSTYNKVISGASSVPSDAFRKDLAWQFKLQRLWERLISGTDRQVDDTVENLAKLGGIPTLPSPDFLYGDSSHCNPVEKPIACSAVMPSLPLTINWLRDCVRQNPSLKLEVLVTGSLHLVGDVLRLLKR